MFHHAVVSHACVCFSHPALCLWARGSLIWRPVKTLSRSRSPARPPTGESQSSGVSYNTPHPAERAETLLRLYFNNGDTGRSTLTPVQTAYRITEPADLRQITLTTVIIIGKMLKTSYLLQVHLVWALQMPYHSSGSLQRNHHHVDVPAGTQAKYCSLPRSQNYFWLDYWLMIFIHLQMK